MLKNIDKNTLMVIGGVAFVVSVLVVKVNEKLTARKTETAVAA